MVDAHWPLFRLRLLTPRLELRLPRDEDLPTLADLIDRGIHPADYVPFTTDWSQKRGAEAHQNMYQYHWRCRAEWDPAAWSATFGVFRDGEPIGAQGVEATNFALTSEATTGSWLAEDQQGRGYGREMRTAVLHFLFEGLGASAAHSSARLDNDSSRGVSRALGYEENGQHRTILGDGQAHEEMRYRISRQDWLATDRIDVEIDGLDDCRSWFGVSPP